MARSKVAGKPARLRSGILCLLALLICMSFSTPLMAQAGQLDSTFGTGGVFTLGVTNTFFATVNNVVAVQSDGKIVIGGSNDGVATLARVTSGGVLDTSFGTNGVATVDFLTLENTAVIEGIAIQSDGKILVSGVFPSATAASICRVLSNGSLDASFNGGCTNLLGDTNIPGVGTAVLALQPDGNILLAAAGVLARYTTNGQFDPTFGSGGTAGLACLVPTAIALQSSGQILVASGAAAPGSLGFLQAGSLSRYNADGSLDARFAYSGLASSVVSASAIAVQGNDEIIVAGTVASQPVYPPNNSVTGFGLVRYTVNGVADPLFGGHGVVITPFASPGPGASAFALAIQANGDIIAAGQAGNVPFQGGGTSSFALARYNLGGFLDSTFGSGGLVTTSFNDLAFISATVLQSDGKIVVSGNSFSNGGRSFVAARYLSQ